MNLSSAHIHHPALFGASADSSTPFVGDTPMLSKTTDDSMEGEGVGGDDLADVLASPYPRSIPPTGATRIHTADVHTTAVSGDASTSVAPTSSSSSSSSAPTLAPTSTPALALPTDVKKQLRDKNKEIERLNAECLDLEDQVVSLQKEVESAWQTYKQSQEAAAERESDLQDEIKQVQRAKQTDKQQLNVQMTDASRELEESRALLQKHQSDKEELQMKIDEMVEYSQEWTKREATLLKEIDDAKRSSFAGNKITLF